MQIERTQSEDVVLNRLPDGSRILLDRTNETVFALNATAGAAWEACAGATTLSEVAEKMERTLDVSVSEELAAAALFELEEKKLVKTAGAPLDGSRRKFLTQVGLAAVPLVVAMTMSEQRAYANCAKSGEWNHGHQPEPLDSFNPHPEPLDSFNPHRKPSGPVPE